MSSRLRRATEPKAESVDRVDSDQLRSTCWLYVRMGFQAQPDRSQRPLVSAGGELDGAILERFRPIAMMNRLLVVEKRRSSLYLVVSAPLYKETLPVVIQA